MSGYSLYPFVCLPFLRVKPGWGGGRRFEPLRRWVNPRLFGGVGVGFKGDIQEQLLGQYQIMSISKMKTMNLKHTWMYSLKGCTSIMTI